MAAFVIRVAQRADHHKVTRPRNGRHGSANAFALSVAPTVHRTAG
jgi:hypothetical protein